MQMQMQQMPSWNGAYPTSQPTPASLDWSGWVQRLYQAEQRLQQMAEQLANLQKQLDGMKDKPPLHIEYHFDQLKVNHLQGTLNVGLSPQGVQGIESFETPDPSCWNVTSEPPDEAEAPMRSLQNEMSAYMNNQSVNALIETERQFGVTLEESHRRKVIEDVDKQVKERVHYYARMTPYPDKGTEQEQQLWSDSIKDKTRRDIQGAFAAYISKQQQQAQQSQKGGQQAR